MRNIIVKILLFSCFLLVGCIEVQASDRINIEKKIGSLGSLVENPTDEQLGELTQITEFIEANWQGWMNPAIAKKYSYLRFQVTENSYITVHPNVPEVCIFLNGHSTILGVGAFKSVFKAISYELEEEVAVATPHLLEKENEILFSTVEFMNADLHEAEMLEAVQGCGSVIKVHFIAYHWSDDFKRHFPIIVSKYYNGGSLYEYMKHCKQFNFEDLLKIVHDIIFGVLEIKNRKIAHNDLHWGNILINFNKENQTVNGAVIADFGLAKKILNDKQLRYNSDNEFAFYYGKEILKNVPEGNVLSHFFKVAYKMETDVPTVYKEFNDLLVLTVGESTARRIRSHSMKKRSIKQVYENIIKWTD